MPIELILKDCKFKDAEYRAVHGGDINQCYHIKNKEKEFFLKVNSADQYPGMFQKEMNGLNALRGQSDLKIPSVITTGSINNKQYLLMQWLEPGKPGSESWKNFGKDLAILHKKPRLYYGFEENNYIGNIPQLNTRSDSWEKFYTGCRVEPLIKILFDKGDLTRQTVKAASSFCKNLGVIFPEEQPALLHGDLWSGNFMFTMNGQAALFDPAVYYGHREMDLGMTKLFGGFGDEFYPAYQETYPLEKDWKKRTDYTQLYPLLVHAILFDGHYIQQCREILHQFL
jgi:fructosamine-3-kinase